MKDQKQTTQNPETITRLLQDAEEYRAQNPKPKRKKPLTPEERAQKIEELIFCFSVLGLVAEDPAKDGEAK